MSNKKELDTIDVSTIDTASIVNFLSSPNFKLSPPIEDELTAELWKRYPFYIITDMAKNITELQKAVTGIIEIMKEKGLIEE